MYEHGPYLWGVNHSNLTLIDNPFTWASAANMIYLESPAGVGFSYGTDNNDYNTNDAQTALDNYDFLLAFFKAYPALKSNKFFVSGESYAGVYVPMLAQLIVQGNKAVPANSINLQGILVGNGVSNSDGESLMNSWVPFTFGHGLMSNALYQSIVKFCTSSPNGAPCQKAVNSAFKAYDNIDPYNIIGNCFSQRKALPSNSIAGYLRSKRPAPLETPPCVDAVKGSSYLNMPTVQHSIHVRAGMKWDICSNKISYHTNAGSMIPIYKELLQNNVRVLIYSGDDDSVVPFPGSEYWTRNLMGLNPLNEWQQWTYTNPEGTQVGGFVTTYPGNFAFTTVRAAGHMVPQTQRRAALAMFKSFISNQPL
jgi:carboxypeptidase C (cathepsin A)